jgi:eukaryotic-like serine/threonine-protein kinase
MNSSSDARNPVELLAEEFLDRKRRGEQPTLREYLERHPELAGEIRDLFPALLIMENLGESSGGTTGSLAADNGAALGIRLERLGDYRILREIGRGGMGVVYEAEQESLGRRVALKVLSAGSLLDPKQIRRFEREAKAAARLHHTNIVPVFGVGHQDGHHYFVMQLIAGLGLDVVLDDLRRLRGGKSETKPATAASRVSGLDAADVARSLLSGRALANVPPADGLSTEAFDELVPAVASAVNRSPAESGVSSAILARSSELSASSDPDRQFYRSVARIGIQVAGALEYANGRGILHRDVKPSNLLVDNHGNVWVADFGLAKTSDADDLTHTGDILGTIRYMAPERFSGRCDARSDVYSLGLTLYELVALRPAFEASDRHRLIERVLHEEPERLKKLAPGVPRDLETIIAKATARDPAGRYTAAADLADDLRRFVEDRPIRARRASSMERASRWCRRNPWLAALSAALVMALLGGAIVASIFGARASRQATIAKREAIRAGVLATELQAALDQSNQLAADLKSSLELSQSRRKALNLERARTVVERGQTACERGELGPGLLYLVEGWRSAVEAGDDELAYNARACLSAWRHQSPHLLRPYPQVAAGSHNDVAISRDGITLAVFDGETIRLLDAANLAAIGSPIPYRDNFTAMMFRPDGNALLVVGGPRASAWDATTGRPIGQPIMHQGIIYSAAYSPDGKTILTGGADKSARIWDAATGRQIGPALVHDSLVHAVAFSPDGNTVFTGSLDQTARLWNAASGRPIVQLLARQGVVACAAFSPDGQTLLTGSHDQTARLWDAASGAPIGLPLVHRGPVIAVAFDSAGKRAVTAALNDLRVWDAATGLALATPMQDFGSLHSRALKSDGTATLSASNTGTVRVWDTTAGGVPVARPLTHAGRVYAVAFSPNGKAIVTGGSDGTARLWDTATGKLMGPPLTHRSAVRAVAFSPDGRTVVTGSADATARLWDVSTGQPTSEPLSHTSQVVAVAFAPDGKTVLTGSYDTTARLWDAATGKPKGAPLRHREGVLTLAFSPDGKTVLTGSSDKTARLWNAASGQPIGQPLEHQGAIRFVAVAYGPDGKTVLTSCDKTAQLWDAKSGDPIGRALAHEDVVAFVAYSPDGRRALTAAGNEVRYWDPATGKPIGPPITQRDRVITAAFSPDGRRILTGGSERLVRLCDAATGQQLGPALVHGSTINVVAFSPDGRTAVCASGSEALLWDTAEFPDDLTRLEHWVHVNTGLALDPEGRLKNLDAAHWQDERDRLASLGGVPEVEPRWRLDPVLFGTEPTARAKAWVERKRWAEAEAAYLDVVLARPFDAFVILERARFYSSRSQPEKAELDYAKSYALGSRDARLIESIVGSESLFRRTVAETPGAATPLVVKHGELMVSQSRWQDAAIDFAWELDLLPPYRLWNSPRSERALALARWNRAYDALLALRPDDGHLWCVRGRYHALRGQWERAAADFARGVRSAPPDSEEWFEHACLRLIIGDHGGYRSFVREIVGREAGTSNPYVAYVLARSCVLCATSVVEPEQVIRWAEQAVKAEPLPWYQGALGAAYYRAGQFDQAVRWLEESNRSYKTGAYAADSDLENRLLLALAHMRLGHAPAARDLVRGVQRALKRVDSTRTDGAVSLGSTDWLPLQILLSEAEAVVLYDPIFPADPFAIAH